ncbi:TerC/Alx family metal homeostasis membrane protein [Candidatus Aquiluna sp. UB-MaderosW2red]|uniref:TerC/Alx family metal homeostasis membrane protein n=1 Tax=Candidatus Aquiluna sp. UB-MaderosW2red TaxID=1855377 RepID=UPI000875DE5E|nr:TerC/Alx family metal homeostasis membrane protein [Candidatus Aquiluna sp. UB-MaderosW2red]SCX08641.1 tellurite resistance protein TerC [Candidatus Aquiluna sp. UB-MaderosW2red]
MNVELWVWILTIGILGIVLSLDFFLQARRPHEPTMRESGIQVTAYISLALLFTFVIGGAWGPQYAAEYIAGFVTEYSLSVDNLFVFLIIFTQFAVPRVLRSQALLVGIAIALVLRFIFIILGAAFIEAFSWAFYIFGAFLIYTAIKLVVEALHKGDDDRNESGGLLKLLTRRLPTTDEYHQNKLSIIKNGKRLFTPFLLVMISIGFTDLLFALDSIPAVYGLTNEPYIVFVANAFALLGLRQLYFLLGGLMERLKYLSIGLSFILGWIGAKLILHAMHKNELSFINNGEPITLIPEISTELSLAVIVITLVITTTWSLAATSKKP